MKPFLTALACVLIALLIARAYRHRPAPKDAPPVAQESEEATATILPATSPSWTNLTSRAPVRLIGTRASNNAIEPTAAQAAPAPAAINEPALEARTRELLARAALGTVGLDPDADQYWLAAITDENVAPEDRRELILSLNEERRNGANDLPVIASRIALIEQAAPQAVDDDDAATLQEVYRELLTTFSSLANTQAASVPEPATNAEPAR